jgi:uncharacterized protein (DUF2062 family)
LSAVKEKIAQIIKRFKELQGSPSYLARGMTIGVFIGLAPLTPFKTVLILAITFLLPSSTVAALLISALICNPISYVPLYYLAWLIGDFLLPGRASWETLEAAVTTIQQSNLSEAIILAGQIGFDTAVVVLAGGCILAFPLAIISYPIFFRLLSTIAKKRSQKHILNNSQNKK